MGPDPIDIHVGGRVRLRRTLSRLSQGKLAEDLGLTYQLIQKYERGAIRISSSKLYQISQILDVPVSFFFDDMPDDIAGGGRGASVAGRDSNDPNTMAKQETLELVRAYYRVPNEKLRRKVFELVKAASPKDTET